MIATATVAYMTHHVITFLSTLLKEEGVKTEVLFILLLEKQKQNKKWFILLVIYRKFKYDGDIWNYNVTNQWYYWLIKEK